MNKEHVKGAADSAKGKTKEAAGKLTGNKKLEAKGKGDQAKGKARSFLGDLKDSFNKARRSKTED